MALRGIRSTVQRIVVVAGLTVALLVGSVALGPRSDASAARMSCSTALALAQANISTGNVFYGLGDYQTAMYYYGRADAYMDFC